MLGVNKDIYWPNKTCENGAIKRIKITKREKFMEGGGRNHTKEI